MNRSMLLHSYFDTTTDTLRPHMSDIKGDTGGVGILPWTVPCSL